jgi:hypothetical protein
MLGAVISAFVLLAAPGAALAAPKPAVTPALPVFQPHAMSCLAASRFCVAISANGEATAYTSGRWTKPVVIDTSAAAGQSTLTGVACGSTSRCVAFDNLTEDIFLFNGTSWTVEQNVDIDGGGFESISCPAWNQCTGVDYVGNSVTEYSGVWSTPQSIDGSTLTSVSCPTTSFCLAGDSLGFVLTRSGTTWSSPHRIDQSDDLGISVVSCISQYFCAAADGSRVRTYIDHIWHRSQGPGPKVITGLSCASSTNCLALGAHQTYAFGGRKWHRVPYTITRGASAVVSCSGGDCVVLDSAGNAVFDTDGKWQGFGAVPGTAGAS